MKIAKAIFRFTKNDDNNKIDTNKVLKTEINDINNSRNKLFLVYQKNIVQIYI